MRDLPADRRVPALIVKIGRYPVHSGGLGAIRTLGRLGVPVYAITEDALTPAARSRYCAGWFQWKTTGREQPETLVAGLREVAGQIGRRAVAIPTDDEAATLLAEHAEELAGYFLLPAVQPSLPRQLASKHELYRLCCEHAVPAPDTAHLGSSGDVLSFARRATFPVVVKNAEPWVRRRAPLVAGTVLLRTPAEMRMLASTGQQVSLLAQEYIPPEHAQDWIVHLYADANAELRVLFTGVKVRSWPRDAGPTACAYALPNPQLADLAGRFCKEIGFKGIADLDWRFDRRDGQYKLVDFNPRVGNQFRLFETDVGVDVIRALHLDLTGQPVPPGHQVDGRRIVVEQYDLLARLAYRGRGRGSGSGAPARPGRAASTELAWAARDDPLPFFAMWPRLARPLAAEIARAYRRRQGHKIAPGAGGTGQKGAP